MSRELLGAQVRRDALREVAEAVAQQIDDDAVLALDTQLAIRSGSVFHSDQACRAGVGVRGGAGGRSDA